MNTHANEHERCCCGPYAHVLEIRHGPIDQQPCRCGWDVGWEVTAPVFVGAVQYQGTRHLAVDVGVTAADILTRSAAPPVVAADGIDRQRLPAIPRVISDGQLFGELNVVIVQSTWHVVAHKNAVPIE